MNFKKTLLTLVGVLCSLGMWAATDNSVTFGLTQSFDGTAKKFGPATYTGTDHVTNKGVALGSSVDSYMASGSTKKVKYNGIEYATDAQWRKKVNTTTYDANQWCGYNLEIESGYKLNITGIQAYIAVADNTYKWKVVIVKESGEVICESRTFETITGSTLYAELYPSDFSNEQKEKMKGITGNISVRIYMYQGGGTKYFAVPRLTVTGEVSEDKRTSHTLYTFINNSAAGTINGGGSYIEGESVTPSVTLNAGWYLSHYELTVTDVPGVTELAPNEATIVMDKDYNLTAIAYKLPKVTFEKGDATGTPPAVMYATVTGFACLPFPYFLTVEDSSFVGWTDGTNIYAADTYIGVNSDRTLTPVFAKNTVALGNEESTVNWNFNKSTGAPEINCENREMDYVSRVNIKSTDLDVVMHVNTKKGAYADGVTGKLNNVSQTVCAQVNKGTIFTIPAMKGMTITYTCTNGTPKVGSVLFDGKEGTLEGKVFTYTYNGNASTIDIVATESNYYPNGISAKYPKIEKPVLGPDFLPVDPQGNGEAIYTDGYLPVDPSTLGHTNGMITFPEETPEQEGANSGDAATGINNAQTAGAQVIGVYGANGAKAAQLQKGLNIIKLANGKTVKVVK